jgi:ribonuclease J
MIGIPDSTADGMPMGDIAYNAVVETFDTLPKARRRDPDSVAEAIRRGVRAAVAQHWRKKPNVTVHILIV